MTDFLSLFKYMFFHIRAWRQDALQCWCLSTFGFSKRTGMWVYAAPVDAWCSNAPSPPRAAPLYPYNVLHDEHHGETLSPETSPLGTSFVFIWLDVGRICSPGKTLHDRQRLFILIHKGKFPKNIPYPTICIHWKLYATMKVCRTIIVHDQRNRIQDKC